MKWIVSVIHLVAILLFLFFGGATWYFMLQNISNYVVISMTLAIIFFMIIEEIETRNIYDTTRALFKIFILKPLGH